MTTDQILLGRSKQSAMMLGATLIVSGLLGPAVRTANASPTRSD
jgi:hypothetical protein